jgi:excisionase family DNA binding protein
MPSNISVVQQALRRIDMDALLSVEEAARKLGGLSKYTIQAWLSSGKLQRTKVGSRTMIRESDLSSVIEVGGKSIRAGRRGTADAA